jgi:antitoxin (DNA-binding transcriptional repressor) of toxin-antitoxin stability system
MTQTTISQRDLRTRSKEIMDCVERGESFTVTRGGHEIGELVPLPQKRTFITRDEFMALGRGLPVIDADQFWADIDAVTDPYYHDRFAEEP